MYIVAQQLTELFLLPILKNLLNLFILLVLKNLLNIFILPILRNLLNLFILPVVYGLAVSKRSNNLHIWGGLVHQCLFTFVWRFASSPGSIPRGSEVQLLLQGEVMFNVRKKQAFNDFCSFQQPLYQVLFLRTIFSLIICRINGEHALRQ